MMIGMPRMIVMATRLVRDRKPIGDTRISAHTSPSAVASTSEPSVTRIVSPTPCSRIGRNSPASRQNPALMTERLLEAPLLPHGVALARPFGLGRRGVDLLQHRVVLARADADRADDRRLEALDQPDLGEGAL